MADFRFFGKFIVCISCVLSPCTSLIRFVRAQIYHSFSFCTKNSHLWSAQDGAPPHRLAEIRQWLSEFFHEHVVTFNHSTEWPPRSPGLIYHNIISCCDTLRVKSSEPLSKDINDLRNRIIDEADQVKGEPKLSQKRS